MKVKQHLSSILGQNTAEYLIMLTLVAIGSIGLMTAFGKTIQSKIAYVSSAISGQSGNYTAAQKRSSDAAKRANDKAAVKGDIKMEGIDVKELQDN